MNPKEVEPQRISDDEITKLMMTLHETVRRLGRLMHIDEDELIKVSGGGFRLQRLVEQLPQYASPSGRDILDALPGHIAVLDAQGIIISFNEAWRRFCNENDFRGIDYGVGLNYLAACDSASGEEAAMGHQAAIGIRAILGGTSKAFSTKYPCHSPTVARWFWMTVLPIGDSLRNGALVMHENVTERNEVAYKMHRLAHYDSLTSLPNRLLFNETLRRILPQAADRGLAVAVLLIELDHFKNVNDTLGHAMGDELLTQFGDRLRECVGPRDTLGRIGGDEFAVIFLPEEGKHGATLLAKQIQEALKAPFNLNGSEVTVTSSIGITVYPDDALDADTLVKYAETAMYRAKHAGRDTFRFFTGQMNIEVVARLKLERALRKAAENDEFVLYYQPKVDIASGHIVGLEALLRWRRPDYGLVLPKDFIAVLEEMGLVVGVGSRVIDSACKQIRLWLDSPVGPIHVSVNVAARQFISGDLDRDVSRALNENRIDASLLELELTESSLMLNTDRTISTMKNLQNCGVQISIDDFGTGYSSLAYLRRFPIDKLKIDIAFVREVTTNRDDAAIVIAIIQMAHSLGLCAIAEGVETEGQLAFLRLHGCDEIQGCLFSDAVAVPIVEQMLIRGKRLSSLLDF